MNGQTCERELEAKLLEYVEVAEGRLDEAEAAMEEASSILLSVKIQYEKRNDLTVVEKELLATIRDWISANPPPGGDV